MISYEEIKKANESINVTEIKGKNYAEVNQRIKAFRMVYPTGFIITTLDSNEGGICVFRAEVGYRDAIGNSFVIATGTAYEKEGSTFINKTSYIENCETSAVGRALGMAGFGIDVSVASAEEVQNAMLQQKQSEKIKAVDVKALRSRFDKLNIEEDGILEQYEIEKLEDMTNAQYTDLNNRLNKAEGGKK